MSGMIGNPGQQHLEVRGKWGWFVALGIALIVLAVIAWLDVVAVTIAGTIFIGAMLLVGGVFQLVHAFMMQGWRSLVLGLLGGALSVIAGLLIMTEPLRGALVLTILVVAALLAGGVTRIVIGVPPPRDGPLGMAGGERNFQPPRRRPALCFAALVGALGARDADRGRAARAGGGLAFVRAGAAPGGVKGKRPGQEGRWGLETPSGGGCCWPG